MHATKVRKRASESASLMDALDRTDKAILRILQRDASLSNVALAAKSISVRRRASARRATQADGSDHRVGRAAESSGARCRNAGDDWGRARPVDPDSFAAFEKSAAKVSGCMECHVVTGEFDYFMLVRTRDSDSFNRLHAEQLLHLPGVRQIRSFMVLKQVLSKTQFPI